MAFTLVGWRTNGRMLDVFTEVDVPVGLQWFPGHEVGTEQELTLTLELLGKEPMLIFSGAAAEDLDALGVWLTRHAASLRQIETAVISDDWKEILHSLEATLAWPKWPLAWFPFRRELDETYGRLEYLAHRAGARRPAERAIVQAGRS